MWSYDTTCDLNIRRIVHDVTIWRRDGSDSNESNQASASNHGLLITPDCRPAVLQWQKGRFEGSPPDNVGGGSVAASQPAEDGTRRPG
jgi:hypothetical protein